MTDIDAGAPLTPHVRDTYRKQCERGVALFQKTLEEYQQSELPAQKEKYKDVMGKAMLVIQETAAKFLSQELQKQQQGIEKDYEKFIANSSPENLNKLQKDLQNFQKKI